LAKKYGYLAPFGAHQIFLCFTQAFSLGYLIPARWACFRAAKASGFQLT
jgi:hypothetical protein